MSFVKVLDGIGTGTLKYSVTGSDRGRNISVVRLTYKMGATGNH